MKNTQCTLKFFITDINILNMDVDMEKKFAKITHLSHEKSVSPILPKGDRSYSGLERRLQIYMQSKQALPELIEEIDTNGIHVPYHDNLNIQVVYKN